MKGIGLKRRRQQSAVTADVDRTVICPRNVAYAHFLLCGQIDNGNWEGYPPTSDHEKFPVWCDSGFLARIGNRNGVLANG